jgi:hypothetical protein
MSGLSKAIPQRQTDAEFVRSLIPFTKHFVSSETFEEAKKKMSPFEDIKGHHLEEPKRDELTEQLNNLSIEPIEEDEKKD